MVLFKSFYVLVWFLIIFFSLKEILWGAFIDDRGIGRGDHFLPKKFIKRTFKH